MVDDHLFMYQILSDGSPVIDGEGFEWDGRKEHGYIQVRNIASTFHSQN